MTANNREKCADTDKSVCDYNEFRRLRYFHGMLLDDKDFSSEQEYHDHKRRFLNRMLHGSGVVCGLELNGKKDGRWIEVTSGLALDCSGNEIWVPRTTRIDLASLLPPKEKGKNQAECEDKDAAPKPNTYYIGIRYEEKPTNPVSVYLPSGGCEERTCENSRYKEGYCVEIVQCCPEKYPDGLLKKFCGCPEQFTRPEEVMASCPSCYGLEDKKLCQCLELEKFCEQSVPCPECGSCDKPCSVVLGQITINPEDGRLVSVCLNECRQYVLTGRMLQHMFLGVLAGAEDFFYIKTSHGDITLPSAGELAHNPIKALCWLLRYALIEGGDFKTTDCGKKKEEDRSGVEAQMVEIRQELAAVQNQSAAELSTLRNLTLVQEQRLKNLESVKFESAAVGTEPSTTEAKTPAETQPTPQEPAATAEKPAAQKSPKTPTK
jgi:hypothetical protein